VRCRLQVARLDELRARLGSSGVFPVGRRASFSRGVNVALEFMYIDSSVACLDRLGRLIAIIEFHSSPASRRFLDASLVSLTANRAAFPWQGRAMSAEAGSETGPLPAILQSA